MTLQTLLEQEKERLISALSGADPVSAVRSMNAALDRILYAFNDGEENPRVRAAADGMLQAAKAACSLADCAGETTIYGRTEYGKTAPGKRKLSKGGLLLLVLGLIGAASTVLGAQFLASSAAGLPPRWV